MIAASAFAFCRRAKVAGLYDHATGRHLRLAAESRGEQLQGYDGDRNARFGGTLPELRDASNATSIHMETDGMTATGYDRSSSCHFTARVESRLVQLYDHGADAWFAFDVQTG